MILDLGIPLQKYGQSYYSLRSIFFDRVPPPVIHVHLRVFNIAQDVPIGDLSASNPRTVPKGTSNGQTMEVDIPEEEKQEFDLWLRELWRNKDQLITRFLERDSFVAEKSDVVAKVEFPLQLRHKREIPDAFCFFIPALLGFLWAKLKHTI